MEKGQETQRLRILPGDLDSPEVHALLTRHLDLMRSLSPPESVHALDLSGLKAPDVTFWSLFVGETLVGCGALKELDATTGEIKSMHVLSEQRGKDLGGTMLRHILGEARDRGYQRLFLETGAPDSFRPAQKLYERYGFEVCGPFADYKLDSFSLFMTRTL